MRAGSVASVIPTIGLRLNSPRTAYSTTVPPQNAPAAAIPFDPAGRRQTHFDRTPDATPAPAPIARTAPPVDTPPAPPAPPAAPAKPTATVTQVPPPPPEE